MGLEHITNYGYAILYNIVKPHDENAAQALLMVGRREGLHSEWYKKMTAFQIEDNPGLIVQVAEGLRWMKMPYNETAPDYAEHVREWFTELGGSTEKIKQNMGRFIYHPLGDIRNTGRLVMDIGAQEGRDIHGISLADIRAAFNQYEMIGGPGYGLIGEAFMEKLGIEKPLKFNNHGPVGRARGLLRTFVANRMDFDI